MGRMFGHADLLLIGRLVFTRHGRHHHRSWRHFLCLKNISFFRSDWWCTTVIFNLKIYIKSQNYNGNIWPTGLDSATTYPIFFFTTINFHKRLAKTLAGHKTDRQTWCNAKKVTDNKVKYHVIKQAGKTLTHFHTRRQRYGNMKLADNYWKKERPIHCFRPVIEPLTLSNQFIDKENPACE